MGYLKRISTSTGFRLDKHRQRLWPVSTNRQRTDRWIGLAGSDVELADGTVVVADTAYLTRAIADPSAELVAGYNLKMPANRLSDAEIADIVAFIETLDG